MSDQVFEIDLGGLPGLFVSPSIPDDAPEFIREGMARRRLAMIEGSCPCGAKLPKLNRAQRRKIERGRRVGVTHLTMVHENDCPASDDALFAAIDEWKRSKQSRAGQ